MSDVTEQKKKGLYLLHIDAGNKKGVRSGPCSKNRMAPPSRVPNCSST
jgi:hypothetical protein